MSYRTFVFVRVFEAVISAITKKAKSLGHEVVHVFRVSVMLPEDDEPVELLLVRDRQHSFAV